MRRRLQGQGEKRSGGGDCGGQWVTKKLKTNTVSAAAEETQ